MFCTEEAHRPMDSGYVAMWILKNDRRSFAPKSSPDLNSVMKLKRGCEYHIKERSQTGDTPPEHRGMVLHLPQLAVVRHNSGEGPIGRLDPPKRTATRRSAMSLILHDNSSSSWQIQAVQRRRERPTFNTQIQPAPDTLPTSIRQPV
ncbi:hypothetical protein ACLOJK_038671 [Asimina triloba]